MIYDFAGFSLDTARMELRRGQDVLAMEPRAFQLLQLLVENVDRVVSKDDITDAIWPNVQVTDASISTAMRQIRKVLGDDGSSQSIIKTVRGMGFRLVAPVQERAPANVAATSPTVAVPDNAPVHAANNQPVVAVLPFRLIGADAQQTAIAEAIPSELIATLSRLRWIKVIARGSSFRFGDANADLDEVRRKVGATYALTGVVELLDQRVTVIVELSDTRSGNVVWSDSFQGGLDDVHGMRARVARDVVTALELRVPLNEADRLALAPTENLDAWGHYHLGVRHMYRYNRTDNLVAEAHFKRAVALDPNFARANAGLSYTEFQNFFQQFGHDPEHHKSLALNFAEKSVDLDPLDPFCNLILGRAKCLFGEVDDCLGWITRSIDLNPNYSFGY